MKKNIFLLLSLLTNLVLIGAIFYLIHRVGGLKFMMHRINNGGLAGVYENRKNLFDHLKMEKGSIIFLGDSITEYGQWGELTNHPKVKNRGIAGDTTWGLLRRLKTITDTNPSIIFLMIGVNDFLFTDEKEIVQNYTEIIQRIKKESPATQLIIQSVLPVNAEVKKTIFSNEAILSLNKSIHALAQNNDLVYLNIHQKLLDEHGQLAEKYTNDGVHINGAAYTVWKTTIQPFLNKSNPPY